MSPEELSEQVSTLSDLHEAAGKDAKKLQSVLTLYDQSLSVIQSLLGKDAAPDSICDQVITLTQNRNVCRNQLDLLMPGRKNTAPVGSSLVREQRPARAITAPPALDFGQKISIEAIDEKLLRIEAYQDSVADDLEGLEIALALYDQIRQILFDLAAMVQLEGSKRNLFEDRIVQLNIKKAKCRNDLEILRSQEQDLHSEDILPSASSIQVKPSKSFDLIKSFNPLKLTPETPLEDLDEWILALQRLSTQCEPHRKPMVQQLIRQALTTIAAFLTEYESARLENRFPPLIAQSEIEERIITLNVVSSLWTLS